MNLFFPVMLALSACTGSPTTKNKEAADTTSALLSVDSITYTQQRQSLTNELEALVTSYDETINQLKQTDDKAIKELVDKLEISKDQVERDLQEVNTTALNGWDTNYVERIKISIKKNKNELDELKSMNP